MRPRVSVYIAISLDQCIARDDGGLDWLAGVQDSKEDYGYAAFMATVDAVVLGRSTYDTVLGFDSWPFADKRVVVLTHRPLTPRFGESVHAGALAPLMATLASQDVRRVYLDGGVTIRQGLEEEIVDDLTLSLVPVILGGGRPLFSDGLPESAWRLESAQAYPSGLAQVRYSRR